MLENLLLLDIETVPAEQGFQALSPDLQALWSEKFTKIAPDSEDIAAGYSQKAGIYAEFGKIICISVGYFHKEANVLHLRLKSFSGVMEAPLLKAFFELLQYFAQKKPGFQLAGHNIREFDVPYICRRAVVNQLVLPPSLEFHGRKPWEVNLVDTLQLWRFGDVKHYTSLKLLAAILGIATPKDDMDGSMVSKVYWEEQDLPRIVTYCQKDVVTVAQLILRFKGMPLLQPADIVIAPPHS